jgi:hypothetical protein
MSATAPVGHRAERSLLRVAHANIEEQSSHHETRFTNDKATQKIVCKTGSKRQKRLNTSA